MIWDEIFHHGVSRTQLQINTECSFILEINFAWQSLMFTNNLQSKKSDAAKKQNNTNQVLNWLTLYKPEVFTIIWIEVHILLRVFHFWYKQLHNMIYHVVQHALFTCIWDVLTFQQYTVLSITKKTKRFSWYLLVKLSMFWQISSFLELSIQERKP